jgi:hypothetical protein
MLSPARATQPRQFPAPTATSPQSSSWWT